MLYLVNGKQYEDSEEAAQAVFDEADDDAYDEWLDEVTGDVQIGSLTYSASRVLSEIDPIAYRCGRSDWEEFERDAVIEQIDGLGEEDEIDIFGVSVEAISEEEPDDEE